MNEVYLFDWGGTLMVDLPCMTGKMFEWDSIQIIEGAEMALRHLSKEAAIYIATGTVDSTEDEIKAAFARVNLDKYISGYFCKFNTNQIKGHYSFFNLYIGKLDKKPSQVTVVGDSLKKDIEPALALGIQAVWLTKTLATERRKNLRTIRGLNELCL